MRGVWNDDAHGAGYTWFVDCMVSPGRREPDPRDLAERLHSDVAREDGQFHGFDIEVQEFSSSDHFDIDHYSYYKRLPEWV